MKDRDLIKLEIQELEEIIKDNPNDKAARNELKDKKKELKKLKKEK